MLVFLPHVELVQCASASTLLITSELRESDELCVNMEFSEFCVCIYASCVQVCWLTAD